MIRSFQKVKGVKKSGHNVHTGGKSSTDPIYKKGGTDASSGTKRIKRWDDTGEYKNS